MPADCQRLSIKLTSPQILEQKLWLAAIAATLGSRSVLAGQDFPFFVCTSQHAALSTFVLGATGATDTGYALWTVDATGQWRGASVTINKQVANFAVSGCLSVTRERFEVEIPVTCGARCEGFASVGAQTPTLGIVCSMLDPDGLGAE